METLQENLDREVNSSMDDIDYDEAERDPEGLVDKSSPDGAAGDESPGPYAIPLVVAEEMVSPEDDLPEDAAPKEVADLKYRLDRLNMTPGTLSDRSGVPLAVVKKAIAGKPVDATVARFIQEVISQSVADARKHAAISRALRQREISKRLIEDTARRTGHEVTFTAHLRDTWGLFERYFMLIDGALAYATERGSAVIPQQELSTLMELWTARANHIVDEIRADTERLDTLVESLVTEKPDYIAVTAGEFKTVTVRIASPISIALLEAFRGIDPLLLSIDTLWWNGKMSLQEKAVAIRKIRQMLGDLSSSVEGVRRKTAKFFSGISA